MITGIYKIQHLASGKTYVGSSINISNRMRAHKSSLRKNNHVNASLQSSWNKYGENGFEFSTVLICSKENLIMYEQLVMDHYKCYEKGRGFNLRPKAESSFPAHSREPQLKAMQKLWSDPVFKERMRKLAVEINERPEIKERSRRHILALKKNPEVEKRRVEGIRRAAQENLLGVPWPQERKDKLRATRERMYPDGMKNRLTHGMSETVEFRAWLKMWDRCTNLNDKNYKTCGGAGIKVCDKWEDFETFYADMGPRPEGCSLSRKDIKLDYTPDNCQWATLKVRVSRGYNVVLVKIQGCEYTLADACRKIGASPSGVRRRIRVQGETHQQAIDHFIRWKARPMDRPRIRKKKTCPNPT